MPCNVDFFALTISKPFKVLIINLPFSSLKFEASSLLSKVWLVFPEGLIFSF